MEELTKRKYIIITNADKGGAVVIMDVEKYINEDNRQLSDKHKKIQRYNTVIWLTIRLTGLKKNLLSKELADGLKSVNPKTPKILHFTQDT